MRQHTASEAVLAGGGEMGALMRSIDWSKTALGPVELWPQSLRTSVSTCLNSRFPIFVWWGPELRMFYNDAYRVILGSKHPQSLGARGHEVWPEIWHIVGPMLEGVLHRGDATWSENTMLPVLRRGFLEESYFTFSYSPIQDESGGIGGVFTAVYETTGQVLSERRLRLLQALPSRTSGARTAEGACTLAAEVLGEDLADLPFCRLYLLDAASGDVRLAASTGPAPAETRSLAFLPGGDAAEATLDEWSLREVLSTGRAVLVEGMARRFGSLVPAGARAALESALVLPLVRPGNPAPAGVLVAGVSPHLPLDERYRSFLELVAGQVATAIANVRALREAEERAEALAELDRAKTAFFSNVSHEFRTPLTLMLGPVEDSLTDTRHPLSPEQRERQLLVHRNGLRLMRLVNALLEFSRIEAGRVQSLYEPTDLAVLTRDLASAFRSAAEKAGLRLVVDCPPLDAPVWVDRGMWEKVVLNLLSNAFKFTLEGELCVTQRVHGDFVELSVRDTGLGIPEAELPRIFERFHRLEQTRGRSIEGSGIGLALVQELVRLHGGHVHVASEPGKGSTFTVSIPTGMAHLPKERLGTASPLPATRTGAAPFVQDALQWLGEAPGSSAAPSDGEALPAPLAPVRELGRIVLADDNADMRDYVARILANAGWKVEPVRDGAAALDATRARVPDLVLSDVMMPGLDGFALLAALRKDSRTAEVPVILLSARAGEEATVEGLKAGANDYLVKPFGARELLARVEGSVRTARAQQEQRRAEAERERFFQLAPDMFCVAGMDAYFRRVNPAFPRTLGWSEEELYSRPFLSLVHPEDMPSTLAEVEKLSQGHVTVRFENRYQCKNGEYKWLAWAAAPVIEQGFMYAAARDMTEARRAEAERERLLERERDARQEAEEANRLKDEFLSTVSHELRTPLTAMLGWVQLLRTGSLPPERRERALETVERNARAQGQLIEDLLDVSRILSGKMKLDVAPVEVSTLVEQALDSVRPAADARGIRLQAAMDSTGSVMGDAHRLQQVVWNLLSNAVKFTPRAGRVQVFVERRDSAVEITVADTGQGISADFLPHVFERFRQADGGTRRQYGGLGLGLSIVRHLVEMHGGSVTASSLGEGQGATFVVRLPLSVALRSDSLPDMMQASAPRGEFTCPPQLNGLRVLLVDDEGDTREFLRALLEGCAARVTVATSAAEGLEALRRERPDVLVSDIGMPGEDGYGFIRKVRALPASQGGRTPAVALTAYARTEDRTRVLLAGFQAHVPKPVEPAELLAVLASLSGHGMRG